MVIIIGLGNPGAKYETTRHNIGFLVVDSLVKNYKEIFRLEKRHNSEIANVSDPKILVAKPQTFMNNSGEAVQSLINFYKVDLNNVLIIHDDLDIQFGKSKLSYNKNSAGHHGIESITTSIGNKQFWRLRMGIANDQLIEMRKIPDIEKKKSMIGNFVTSSFQDTEIYALSSIITATLEIILVWLKEHK